MLYYIYDLTMYAEGHGKLEIKDLVNNYHVLVQHSANGSELINAFKKYDINKDGYINLAELKVINISSGLQTYSISSQ